MNTPYHYAVAYAEQLKKDDEMKQEPTAWMSPDGKVSQTEGKLFHIPLYAAKKPLSDEEIEYYEHLIAKLFNCSVTQKVVGLDRVIRAIEERHGIK